MFPNLAAFSLIIFALGGRGRLPFGISSPLCVGPVTYFSSITFMVSFFHTLTFNPPEMYFMFEIELLFIGLFLR